MSINAIDCISKTLLTIFMKMKINEENTIERM